MSLSLLQALSAAPRQLVLLALDGSSCEDWWAALQQGGGE